MLPRAPCASCGASFAFPGMARSVGTILATVCALAPGIAAAQSADPAEKPSPPAISVSVAAGPMQHAGHYWPMFIAGAQFPAGRWIRFEGEVARTAASNLSSEVRPIGYQLVDDRRALAASVNVLFRAGTRRFAGFAGGGAGVHRIRSRFDEGLTRSSFRNGREITVVDTRAGLQIVGGAEVQVAGRLLGFASWRGQLLPEPNMGVTAGARVALTTVRDSRFDAAAPKPVARAGKEIRVTMKAAVPKLGRFVSLSSTELVMTRAGKNERVPLAEVRRIEIVSHHVRRGALIGLVSGVGWALAVCATDDNFCGDDASFSTLASFLGGLGTGIGAALGAMMNAATADGHILFEDRSGPVANVIPILGGRKAGAAVRVQWK